MTAFHCFCVTSWAPSQKSLVISTSCCFSSPLRSFSPWGDPIRNVPAGTRTSLMPTLLVNPLPPSLTDRSTSSSGDSDEPHGPGVRARAAIRTAARRDPLGDTANLLGESGRTRSIPPDDAHDAEALARGADVWRGVVAEGGASV